MVTPTYARVSSLSHWVTFFHPLDGIFRLPSREGETIEHLDLDLRYVDHSHEAEIAKNPTDPKLDEYFKDLHLPKVCKLTLRGGEYCQDDDTRMDCLAEVLLAINPVEVQWLNASTDPSEQLSFATHLVHPAVVAAGENWSRAGTLRRLVIQGGFPCPNLTAPTPFSLTPAATPLPSPGPRRSSFGLSRPGSPASSKFPHTPFSGLPALSTTKPKPVDEERLKAREERRRLAEYNLKPRFEYAFGTWTIEHLRWRLDGRYTPACILTIITHLFKALATTFPSSSRKIDIDLPSILDFTFVPRGIIGELSSLLDKLDVDQEVRTFLEDVVFVNVEGEKHARLWVSDASKHTRDRQTRQIKAEMLLLQDSDNELVSLAELLGKARQDSLAIPGADIGAHSPARSDTSILPGETEAPTEDENEAITPEMSGSPIIHPNDNRDGTTKRGKDTVEDVTRAMSDSMVL